MAISREKILERRKKLQELQLKEEEKLKTLKLKLKEAEVKILESEKKEETERHLIIGEIFADKMKTDETLKSWFEEIIQNQLTHPRERNLFDLSPK